LVARRIVDKNILKLIRMWLKAPVVEEVEDGKKRTMGNDQGTPQGGVISPLLANIYLNVLDKIWKVKKIQEEMGARLIRYADDFVVLCKGNTERLVKGVQNVLGHLGLTLKAEKTRVLDSRQEGFDFLGFTVQVRKSPRTGRNFPFIWPSGKALARIRVERISPVGEPWRCRLRWASRDSIKQYEVGFLRDHQSYVKEKKAEPFRPCLFL